MNVISTTGLAKVGGGSLQGIFWGSASPAMRTVERAAADVAATNLPIFIVGENGSGKGTLATVVHRLSKRSDQDLVKVNCQSLQTTFARDENAKRSRLGLTGRQLRGTILLDEVLELPPALQPQLMAILPEGDSDPEEMKNAPRIITATRSEDGTSISGSLFSRELYYRLRGVVLRIPPLRERQDDIPLLAHFLLNKYADSLGRSSMRLSSRAEEQFQSHSWPGNVRELENAIKTLLAVEDENVALKGIGLSGSFTLPSGKSAWEMGPPAVNSNGSHKDTPAGGAPVSLKEASRTASRTAEKQLITEVLQRTSWNRKRAARELNISYKALLYKLKQNGLSGPTTNEREPLGRGTAK